MRQISRLSLAALLLAAALTGGCMHAQPIIVPPPDGTVPTELCKSVLPPYVISSPDVLYVEVLMPPLQPEKAPYSTSLPPQPINGQFLVRIDGAIGLGIYGTVQVAGLTIDQARDRIREFVAKTAQKKPDVLQVTVDVAAFNSQVYYVITDGAGFGETVSTFPVVGNETVLDAMGRVGGIPSVGSKKRIWLARRSPRDHATEQILPVDWEAIAMRGATQTNYQVLPGDRIYVQAQPIITIDNALAKLLSPVERIFGITLLGSSTVNNLNGRAFGNQNNN